MQDVTDVFQIPLDENGEINADLVCRRCGYNLRGLREEGRCPECGTAIGLSTRGDLLRFADPAWVEKLALGMKYILWGIVVSIIVGGLGGCLGSFTTNPEAVVTAFGIVGGLLGLYGAWILTSPDPSRVGEDKHVTARKVVRIGLLFGVASQLLTVAFHGMANPPFLLVMLLVIGGTAAGLVSVAGEFAKFLYLEKLAERIPDHKLAGNARFLRWAFSIGLGCMVIFGGLMLLATRTPVTITTPFAGPITTSLAPPPGGPNAPASAPAAPAAGPVLTGTMPKYDGTGTYVITTGSPATAPTAATPVGRGTLGALILGGCVFGVAMLVFGIMALILYFRIGKRFREQADIARMTWAASAEAGATPDIPAAE